MRSFDRVHVLLTHKLQVKNKDIISKHMRMCIYMTLYFYKNQKKKIKDQKKKYGPRKKNTDSSMPPNASV